jgi:hypothetical protein
MRVCVCVCVRARKREERSAEGGERSEEINGQTGSPTGKGREGKERYPLLVMRPDPPRALNPSTPPPAPLLPAAPDKICRLPGVLTPIAVPTLPDLPHLIMRVVRAR